VVMNKILQRTVASVALMASPVMAADIAVKAPPPAPAPVYNWTGWYAGVNLGASFGHVKTDFNTQPITVSTSFGGVPIPGFAGSNILYPSGFIGGGQIGYNWQVSPIWVVGLEADIQGALEKESATLTNAFSSPVLIPPTGPTVPVTGAAVTNYAAKIEWFGTVRGRLGYVWGNGEVLTYVTGGLAYGKVDLEGTSTASGTVVDPTGLFSITHAFGHSQLNTGWVVGFGTEGKLLIPGWTYKIESLYMDLGTLDDTDRPPTCLVPCTASGGQIITHTHFTDGILRAGLNYKFY
jgi:outer membrane immunogenic protein